MDPLSIVGLIGIGISTATSVGTAIYSAVREKPKIPGPTAEERMGAALMQSKANQLASMGGLTETEYNRPLEYTQKQAQRLAAQGMEQTRSASPFISNVAAERIAKIYASKGAEMLAEARRDITSLDISTARQNYMASITAQAEANKSYSMISAAERQRAAQIEEWRRQKILGIVTAAGAAAASAMKLVEIGSGVMKKEEGKNNQQLIPAANVSAGQMPSAPYGGFSLFDKGKEGYMPSTPYGGFSFFNDDEIVNMLWGMKK